MTLSHRGGRPARHTTQWRQGRAPCTPAHAVPSSRGLRPGPASRWPPRAGALGLGETGTPPGPGVRSPSPVRPAGRGRTPGVPACGPAAWAAVVTGAPRSLGPHPAPPGAPHASQAAAPGPRPPPRGGRPATHDPSAARPGGHLRRRPRFLPPAGPPLAGSAGGGRGGRGRRAEGGGRRAEGAGWRRAPRPRPAAPPGPGK